MFALRRLFLAMLVAFAAATAHAQAYTSIVIFGDSLSDTGNVSHLSTAAYGEAVAFPGPSFNYTLGSFTDGADTGPAARLYQGVWIKQFADSLPAQPKVIDSLDGGTNYAYANATTANGTNTLPYGANLVYQVSVDNMGKQVADYLATGPTITPATLFVVWGGTNDVLNGSTDAQDTAAASQEIALIQTLIGAGATDFLIPNVIPLGATPEFNNGANVAGETAAAAAFNQALAAGLGDLPAANPGVALHLFPLDTFTLYNNWIASPAAYNLVNVTASAMGLSSVDPDSYLFWDYLHPTTGGHHLLALAAASLLSPSNTTTALASSEPSASAGSSVTFTATVSSAYGIPPGTVTFYDGSAALATSELSATAPATATYTTSNLSIATHSITATYAGGEGFASSTSSAITEIISAPATTTMLSASSSSVIFGAPITFTATVTATEGVPVGLVTFYDGATAIGSGTLSAAGQNVATITTSNLNVGDDTITAVYAGCPHFAASTSAPVVEAIAPAISSTLNPASLTIQAGATAATNFSVNAAGGYTGTISLACGTLPADMSCSFTPGTLTFTAASTTQTGTLTISTSGAPPAAPSMAALLPLLGLTLVRLRKRSRLPLSPNFFLLCVMLVTSCAGIATLSGCASASQSAKDVPAGTYTVPVVMSAGAITTTANLSITVLH